MNYVAIDLNQTRRSTDAPSPRPGDAGSEAAAHKALTVTGRTRGGITPQPMASLLAAALALPGLAVAARAGAMENAIVEGLDFKVLSDAQYVPTGASRMVGSIPASPTATKRYSVECYTASYAGDPIKMRLKVKNLGKNTKFLLKATLEKDGQTQELVANRNGQFSPFLELAGGAGTYTLTLSKVKKTATAPDKTLKKRGVFQTIQECDDAKNAYTGIKKPVPLP